MWEHYCQVERSEMMIGHGEECSWCGAVEQGTSEEFEGNNKTEDCNA